jgi:metal-sulfur cluster biosynthetic enzyme
LRAAILVAATTKYGRVFVVGDDGAKPTSRSSERLDRIAVMATLEEIEEALTNVIDPELGLDFVELGLIYGIQQDSGNVHVTFTLTTPACPIGPQITEQIDEFVSELDGVTSVESTMTFTPPWTPDRMSEDAKFALGY